MRKRTSDPESRGEKKAFVWDVFVFENRHVTEVGLLACFLSQLVDLRCLPSLCATLG